MGGGIPLIYAGINQEMIEEFKLTMMKECEMTPI